MIRIAVAVIIAAISACTASSDKSAPAPWRTVFDSTGDTIVARTSGAVPNEAVRRLVLEQRIGEAEGNDSVTFGRLQYIAVTRDDRIFVFDEQGPSLKLFDSTGTLARYVGRKGAGPGEFEQVTGMGVLPNGGLALWDASHARVNVYDTAGDFVSQWPVPTQGFFTYNGLFTDHESSVLLTLPLSGLRVFGESGYVRFSATGTIRDTIRIPRWIDTTPQLLGTNRDRQVRVSMALPFAPTIRDSWSPSVVLVSGPSAPYVIYVTHGASRPIKIEREWVPVAVLPEERADHRASITWRMRLSIPEWTWSGPDIPDNKPAYDGLLTSEDGRIWVALHSQAERVQQGDAPQSLEPGMPPRPPQRYQEPNVYDVFAPDGTYLARVRVVGQRVMRMRGNRVWGVLTDSLGVEYLARWRVEPPFQPRPASR